MFIKQRSNAVIPIFILTISFTLFFTHQFAYAQNPDEKAENDTFPISNDEMVLDQDESALDVQPTQEIKDDPTHNEVLDQSVEAEETSNITQDETDTSLVPTDNEDTQYNDVATNELIEEIQTLSAAPMLRSAALAPVAKTAVSQLSATDKLAQQNKNTLQNNHIYIITSALNANVALASQNEKTTARTNVDIETLTRNTTQQWRTSIDTLGYVTFIHEASGLALDLYNGDAKNKQNVWLFTPNDSLAQKWIVITDSTGTRIASALDTNLVLDLYYGKTTTGTNVWMWENTKTSDQRWSFYDLTQARLALDKRAMATKSYISAGQYQLLSAKKLDMASIPANNNARANVSLQNSNGTTSQSWKVTIDNKGYATFVNTASGKALDVYNANAVNYTNVWQFNSNDSLAQKWVVEKNSDGTYTLTSALYPDMVLDIYGGSTTAGTN
ncbi:MAG: RICIN domain-containing protein, partial [Eggerthellaceae bacterium]|nr:RICIN domain-containing protein [Eggerthellaceae bacterium]